MAMHALAAHKLRSALTLIGVLVGVFSIIAVMTAMRVMQNNIETELSQLGTRSFVIRKFPAFFVGGDEWEKIWRRKNITHQLAQTVRDKATLAESVAVEARLFWGEVRSRFAQTTPSVRLMGVSPEWFAANHLSIEGGRAILPADIENARNVCVLGNALAKKLFPDGAGLKERIKFEGITYNVVGVLQEQGKVMGGDQDIFVAVPITTGLNRYNNPWRSLDIVVTARDENSFEDTKEQVRGILRAARKVPPGEPDDFETLSSDGLITQFRSITRAARIGAAVVSSIALLAAGVGIMNIMLVSVTERTREIGIRRAIGAKRRNILTQFILEAIVLCEIGGVIGVLLGILSGNLAAYLLKVPPSLPVDWVAFGLLICSVVGVIFGAYPAYKAAMLDPIESLRYE